MRTQDYGVSRGKIGSDDDAREEEAELGTCPGSDAERSLPLDLCQDLSSVAESASVGDVEPSVAEEILSEENRPLIQTLMQDYAWHIGFYLRHNITVAAMDEILRKEEGEAAVRWKTICNRIERYSNICVSRHLYCSRGHEALPLNIDSENMEEGHCSHKDCLLVPAPLKEFRYIYMWERLVSMLQCPRQGPSIISYIKESYLSQMERGFDGFEDFYSESCFREYARGLDGFHGNEEIDVESGGLPVVHLFLFVSTDGAPAFNSSNYSFWPVIVYLANLPPGESYHHENILPLLFIPGNPTDIESFLEPFFQELEQLRIGNVCKLWDGSKVVVKAHLLFVLLDLQALKKVGCIKGVNGICPCRFCSIAGHKGADKSTYYYPDFVCVQKRARNGTMKIVKRKLWCPHQMPLRDLQSTRSTFYELEYLFALGTREDLEALQKSTGIIREPEVCRRVKSVLPYASMPIDPIHLLFENVAPLLVKIWEGKIETGGEHAYLDKPLIVRQVDEILNGSGAGIVDSVRAPRGLKHRGLWKADEWRTFVYTTSLVALAQFLLEAILDGWWKFSKICELSMRPFLRNEDVEELEVLCKSFYDHYCKTYYRGLPERLHLMRYVVHFLLHIPLFTKQCGPLVCASQFPTERYIGVIKGCTKAKNKYAESVAIKWVFQDGARMCEKKSGVSSPLLERRVPFRGDMRSTASNSGRYKGYLFASPCIHTDISELDVRFGCNVLSLLERFYESDLGLTLQGAHMLLENSNSVALWDRLFVQKEDEIVHRKYGKQDNEKRKRSCAYFAGEFQEDMTIGVHYGQVVTFIEHSFQIPDSTEVESRMLILSKWTTSGLKVGRQHQVYSRSRVGGPYVFSSSTIEDVSCIARNIAVVEARKYGTRNASYKTFFVDERLEIDNLLSTNCSVSGLKYRLRGVSL